VKNEPVVYEKDESVVYEPPALVSIGQFAKVTLGRPSWGFERDWTCVMFC
jgi:hypothetical protein